MCVHVCRSISQCFCHFTRQVSCLCRVWECGLRVCIRESFSRLKMKYFWLKKKKNNKQTEEKRSNKSETELIISNEYMKRWAKWENPKWNSMNKNIFTIQNDFRFVFITIFYSFFGRSTFCRLSISLARIWKAPAWQTGNSNVDNFSSSFFSCAHNGRLMT